MHKQRRRKRKEGKEGGRRGRQGREGGRGSGKRTRPLFILEWQVLLAPSLLLTLRGRPWGSGKERNAPQSQMTKGSNPGVQQPQSLMSNDGPVRGKSRWLDEPMDGCVLLEGAMDASLQRLGRGRAKSAQYGIKQGDLPRAGEKAA